MQESDRKDDDVAERATVRVGELAAVSVFADCCDTDLYPLALLVEPLAAKAGDLLMRQGESADFFLIIAEGTAVVEHSNPDGSIVEAEVEAGRILGEIALLRQSARVATVRAVEDLSGWIGGDDAFDQLIELPGVLAMLVRTARQRLAAFVIPIPFQLHDGTELLLRPVLPGDSVKADGESVEFSSETIFRRFMTSREPTQGLLDYLFQVDYVDHFVWVVIDPTDDSFVADVRFVRLPEDRTVAEIAFMVADDYQGRGLGSFLVKALAVAAKVNGVEKFTARVLTDNLAMRAILDQFGAEFERDEPGVVTTIIDVPEIRDVKLPTELIDRIRDGARQVVGALG